MTTLSPALAALGWTLIHSLWQGVLVAAAFGLARLGARRSDPGVRYGLACAALLTLAALPIVTFALVWQTVSADPGLRPMALHNAVVPLALPWLVASWTVGVGVLAARSALQWERLRRLVRDGSQPLHPAWRRRVEALKERIGLRRAVRVFATFELSSPIVTGCWRPTVLVPLSAFTGLTVSHLESLILHELVHIKRWDLWTHRMQLVLETLLFYHPAVWWISHVVSSEREVCCDSTVVSLTGDRLGYAHALTRMEWLRSHLPRQALASTGGSLMSRIRTIVNPSPASSPAPLWAAACGLAAIGTIIALVAITGAIGEPRAEFTPPWMPESVERWSPQIAEAATRHEVDPTLLSIVTLLESRGNPEAVSSWGAVGLMQIMPDTARKIAALRGIADFEVADLRDPATNIDFGAWYLARQIETFGDSDLTERTVANAAAAYNGGPKQLRGHLEEGTPLSAESERYSRLVRELWSDRDKPESATFDGLTGGPM